MPAFKVRPLAVLATRAGRLVPYQRELDSLRAKGEKFASETEFRVWFEGHVDLLGFRRILTSQQGCPDLILEANTGESVRVELENQTASFKSHGHNPRDADMVVAIAGVQRLPIPSYTLGREFWMPPRNGLKKVQSYLPEPLFSMIQERAKEGYRSLSDQVWMMLDIAEKHLEEEK